MKEYYRVCADIDLDAIYDNIEETRKRLNPQTQIMAVIKADAYGHGAVPVAGMLERITDSFGVAIAEEALELRSAGIRKPVLILGYTPAPFYEELAEQDISQTVFQYEMACKLSEAAIKVGKPIKIHIKVDTGMSRIGFMPAEESLRIIGQIQKLPGLILEGIFTHFASSDSADKTQAREQLRKFLDFTADLENKGIRIPVRHAANSAAIMEMPESQLEMVRSGISTYGMYPSDEVDQGRLKLCPAMSVHAYVSYVKTLPEGVGVSYGSTFITGRDTVVATIPVGYADGYSRQLSNQGRVLIHGKSAPIIGRVCMDQFMVDVTDIPDVKEGDTATLMGRDQDEIITAEEIGSMTHSFNYEVVCDVGKRVPRAYYRHGEKVATYDHYEYSPLSYSK
ncbi:alanine racemase [Anaerolentibacter hominis]|uniref:alanine racemase n=1 Tax=Anaerolentibacter hominis TaxID=3079009 RepID=UPI0031B881A8